VCCNTCCLVELLNTIVTPQLISYQCIITSANSQYPLHVWINNDGQFCTKAASDPSLNWDIRDLDSGLNVFLPHTAHWPCTYCGGTNHSPSTVLLSPFYKGLWKRTTCCCQPITTPLIQFLLQLQPIQLLHPQLQVCSMMQHLWRSPPGVKLPHPEAAVPLLKPSMSFPMTIHHQM